MRNLVLSRPDLTNRFRSLRIPMIVLAGGDDPMWTPAAARAPGFLASDCDATVNA